MADLVAEVEASRKRIREVDPEAYSGFVTDVAVTAVGRRVGMKPMEVMKRFRQARPLVRSISSPTSLRKMSEGKRVSEGAKAVA